MKPAPTKLPRGVVVGLGLAIALDTAIQIAWKRAVGGVPGDASFATTVRGAAASPFFYVAMAAFGAQLYNWMRVLARIDLSFAQPITALSYVTVLAISARSLHEEISGAKILGVALILIGVFFISRTPFRTGGGARPGPAPSPAAPGLP
jgi:drug/metabolite transporter (DMT)-like permease